MKAAAAPRPVYHASADLTRPGTGSGLFYRLLIEERDGLFTTVGQFGRLGTAGQLYRWPERDTMAPARATFDSILARRREHGYLPAPPDPVALAAYGPDARWDLPAPVGTTRLRSIAPGAAVAQPWSPEARRAFARFARGSLSLLDPAAQIPHLFDDAVSALVDRDRDTPSLDGWTLDGFIRPDGFLALDLLEAEREPVDELPLAERLLLLREAVDAIAGLRGEAWGWAEPVAAGATRAIVRGLGDPYREPGFLG